MAVCVCAYMQVCVCEAERPPSGRMYEHVGPVGVNKQLIALSLLLAEQKPTEELCYLACNRSLFSHAR